MEHAIPALVQKRGISYAGETILRTKHRGIWDTVTWAQLAERVRAIGTALLAADFGRGDVIAVLSEVRPNAVYADLAILGCGAVSIAIDPDDDADRVCHVLVSSGARLAFVENEEQLDKILTIRDRCPALSRIVVFEMKGLRDLDDSTCVSLTTLTAMGGSSDWAKSVDAVVADQPAVIQFPRGETFGLGRTLSHGDLAHMLDVARARLALRPHDERLAVSRLSDITERVWGLYLALETRCVSNYPEGPDTVIENLRELQPTVLGADAAIWDHLQMLAAARAKSATNIQRFAYEWAIRAGRTGGSKARMADLLVLRAVRREFGLNKLRLAYVGGVSASPAALNWARSLAITIQRVDEPTVGPDERYQALIQNAYA